MARSPEEELRDQIADRGGHLKVTVGELFAQFSLPATGEGGRAIETLLEAEGVRVDPSLADLEADQDVLLSQPGRGRLPGAGVGSPSSAAGEAPPPPPPGTPPPPRPPAGSGSATVSRIRKAIERKPLAAAGIAAAVAVVAGAAIGYGSIASKAGKVDDLEADVERLEDELVDTEAMVDEELADIAAREDAILSKARDRRDNLLDEVEDLEAEVSDKQDQLSEVQAELNAAQETQAKSTFGDGIWEANVDFIQAPTRRQAEAVVTGPF